MTVGAARWMVDGVEGAALPPLDRGLAYGDGLFETVAWIGGRPRRWARHIERLAAGCRRLGLPPPDGARLLAEARALAPAAGDAVVKILLTRGDGARGYVPSGGVRRIVGVHPWPEPPAFAEGVALVVCETPAAVTPALAGLKHLGRLEHVLAAGEVAARGAWEGLMRDPDGWVVSGTRTNLFLVRGGALWTPELSRSGVWGILRAEVLERARGLGIAVRRARIGLEAVRAADEIFLTNALVEILPVTRFEDRRLEPGPVTRRLAAAVRKGAAP